MANFQLDIAKFGGTSVADFKAMTSSVQVSASNPNTRLVVVSACAGVTNILVELASGACSRDKIEELIKKLYDIHYEIASKVATTDICLKFIKEHLNEIRDLANEAAMERSDDLTKRIDNNGEIMK